MNDNKIKHLELIQEVITRMNQNSFQLKGWMITIVSALLALYAGSGNVLYIWAALVPTVLFWMLDAYYLQQERKFRGVYNEDVYKRQGCTAVIALSECVLWAMIEKMKSSWLYYAAPYGKGGGTVWMRAATLFMAYVWINLLLMVCLLYTSRCV